MFANLRRYAIIPCIIHTIIHSAWSQGSVQLTFSSNPVYSGQEVTLTLSFQSQIQLTRLTIDAFNGTLKQGSLFYQVSPSISTAVGVFANRSLNGWPNIPAATSNVSLTLTATPSNELDYNCTAVVFDSSVPPLGAVQILNSASARIRVYICPSTPSLQPSPVAFYDTDNGTIVCESRNGNPPALVSLAVNSTSGVISATASGNDSALVVLSSPLSSWHNATAACRVTNHNCSNMSTTPIFVNVTFNTSVPAVVCSNTSDVVLNVSAYIKSYSSYQYQWTVPIYANITGRQDLESLTVPHGQSGLFNCTVTNNVSMKSTVIVFTVINVCLPSTTPTFITTTSAPAPIWIIGAVIGPVAAVIIAVVLGVLCKRGHCSKRNNASGVLPSGTGQRSDNGSNHGSLLCVYDGPTSWKTSTEHDCDADALRIVDRHTVASGEVASRKGLAPSTSDAPAQDRHYTEDIRKPTRLLIAAEGVASQLSQKTLRTTAVVEYSDRTYSLNDILEKVEKAVPRSSPKFRSVALLLRPAKVGVTLSELDQADLNSSSIQKDKGEKVRNFMARLAKMCLDERGGARMDILNYNGKAPLRLSEGLTNLLGIPTTVSKDQFGVETSTGEGEHAVVADAYFDRNNLGEIVYAELQQPSVKPQAQPRQPDDRVIYSEIKR